VSTEDTQVPSHSASVVDRVGVPWGTGGRQPQVLLLLALAGLCLIAGYVLVAQAETDSDSRGTAFPPTVLTDGTCLSFARVVDCDEAWAEYVADSTQDSQSGIGIAGDILLFAGVAVGLSAALAWVAWRAKHRCPQCRTWVRPGVPACPRCGRETGAPVVQAPLSET
jgi:hypothetical protein